MSNQRPIVKLGDMFKHVKDEVIIQDDETYARLTIRMNGNGIIQRDRVPGHEIGTKRQFIARAGQLVLSKIDARNGAFGILPPECDNAIITRNFWAFDADRECLIPQFFDYLTKTRMFVEFCIRASEGTTNRLYLQEDEFLAQEIMLPTLAEQRRVLSRIEALAAQIHEARTLRHQATEEAEVLVSRSRAVQFAELGNKFSTRPLGELMSMASGEGLTSSQMDLSGPYAVYGGGGLNGRHSRYLFEEPKIVIGRVGARCGCVFVTESKAWVTDNALYLTEISDELDSPFLVHALTTLDLRQQANHAAQPVVSQKKINPMRISVPPLAEQRRIVAELHALQVQVDALKRLQAETAAELAALLPAILDKAFKGEL